MPIDAGHELTTAARDVISEQRAAELAESLFGVHGRAKRLDGEYDDNFRIDAGDGTRGWVFKISHAGEDEAVIALQHEAIRRAGFGQPRLAETDIGGVRHFVRLLEWIPGTLLAQARPHSAGLLASLGGALAKLDRALLDFDPPAAHRRMQWDLLEAGALREDVHCIADQGRRALVTRLLQRVDDEVLPVASRLRRSVIHGDANDFNVVVRDDRVVGLIDFGDIVHSATVTDLAIAAAYVMTGAHDPLGAASHVVAGYHAEFPLTDAEQRVLYQLILARLCVSVVISAARRAAAPDVAYYRVHEAPAWTVLEQLADVPFDVAQDVLFSGATAPRAGAAELQRERAARLGANLSVSYATPLHIVRGWKQYLYDADGREYLDAYNNVAHVGHSHPRVVAAAARQMAILNTNTRYLHGAILEYAERLAAKCPSPLSVCWFVNSGSEANELALRLARAHTGRAGVIVTEGAYHGNTQRLIEVSPYKFNGRGGAGPGPGVSVVPIPDDYRGPFKRDDREAGAKYAEQVRDAVKAAAGSGDPPGAFLVESMPSVAGQIVPPHGYLAGAFAAVRAAGGVCIVDEVQVGFGRTGDFWGFERQGVVPDIVVMGKPMGNGHPIGAVVTTPEIARSFANGMEYFSTFGGNPVSMTVASAVLDVLEEEALQDNARRVGSFLLGALRDVATRCAIVGDVRGAGLFLGVELVRDRETLEPATAETSRAVEALKDRGILTGTEGPHHNVIKIRPPMCLSLADAERLVETLEAVLRSH